MAAVTDDAFEEALVDDFGWRRIELAHLKKCLEDAARQSLDGPATRGLSRAMIAMCYAHWEGYSKNALERYAQLVSKRKPKVSEASDGLVMEHLHRLMKRVTSGDAAARLAVMTAIRGVSDERVNVEKSVLSDTKANLRFAVLADLFERGCIPLVDFELRANLIDVLLCDRRNSVAHGRALFVPPDQSAELCDEVLGLMQTMQDVLVVQVRAKRYLHATT